MPKKPDNKRIDSASRVIHASPQTIYQAFLDPDSVAKWRPPSGMKCHVYKFEAYQGGSYQMAFEYINAGPNVTGKTSKNADVFKGYFLELIPGVKIVELVKFESDDPSYDGRMKITTTLLPVSGGTEVTFSCENVPDGINPEDHQVGMKSTLENLAAFTA